MSAAIWVSTIVLLIALVAIVRAELLSGRRSEIKQAKTNQQINDLAKTAFEHHREMFGKDATGAFPITGSPNVVKK